MEKREGGGVLWRKLNFCTNRLSTAAKTTVTALLHRHSGVLQVGRVDGVGVVSPRPDPTRPDPDIPGPTTQPDPTLIKPDPTRTYPARQPNPTRPDPAQPDPI